jgi:hypothetical protein
MDASEEALGINSASSVRQVGSSFRRESFLKCGGKLAFSSSPQKLALRPLTRTPVG